MPVKELGYHVLNTLYELIFKEKMSLEALNFFTGTSYVAIGTLFGALLTFVFNILAARTLGPTSFGDLALIMTVSTILSISMGVNQTGALKYGSQAQDDSARSRIISTYNLQMIVITAGSLAIYVLFSAQLSNVFGISKELYYFAVAYAAICIFFALTMNSLRILFRIRAFAMLSALQSVVVLASFLIFISMDMKSWQAAMFSLYIGNAAITVILVVHLRQYLKPQFDRDWSKKILKYAVIALPGIIASVFMGVDKILINKLIATAAVGIYNAYYLSSMTIAVTLWSIVNAAFFPYASKSGDRLSIFRKLNKAVPALIAALVPSIILIQLVIFIFYGPQYPFSVELGLLFAFAATGMFLYLCYSSLIASEGTRGAKVSTLGSVIALAVIIGVNVVLIPLIGILGAVFALFFSYLTGILYLVSKKNVLRMD